MENSYDSWGSASERFADEGALCIGIDLGTTNSCAPAARCTVAVF